MGSARALRSGLPLLFALHCAGCAAHSASPLREAILLNDKGHTDAAVQLLQDYVAQTPGAVHERGLLVRLHGVRGNFDAARREAQALARILGPEDPRPLIELGHALELAHRYDEALELYDRAASSAPRNPAGPRVGGLRAAAWGEMDAAEPRLREALRRDPGDARCWHALGLVRARAGDLAGAERAYQQGLARDPAGADNRIGLATLALLRDDPARVLAEYDALLAVHPNFKDAHLGRSWALVRLGRYDEARAAILRAERLRASPRSVGRQRQWLAREQAKSAGNR